METPTHEPQDWPTHCPQCGRELVQQVVDLDPTSEHHNQLRAGEMVAVDVCPDPGCPSRRGE